MAIEVLNKVEKQAAYDAWYVAEVDKGIADCDAGNVLSDEAAEQEIAGFMAALQQKHGKEAA